MEIAKQAVCGTLQSNDCFIRLYPHDDGIDLDIKSSVMAQFGKQIEKVARETLAEMGVTSCRLFLEDKGALDYTIRARVETAVKRANE